MGRASWDLNDGLNGRLRELLALSRVLEDDRGRFRSNTIDLDGLDLLSLLGLLDRLRDGLARSRGKLDFGASVERTLGRSQERGHVLLSTRRLDNGLLHGLLAESVRDIARSGEVLDRIAHVAKGSSLGSCLETTDSRHGREGSSGFMTLMKQLIRGRDRVLVTWSTEGSRGTLGLRKGTRLALKERR